MRTRDDLEAAILHGAVKRVRPKVMTVACAFFGLVPIMWSTGAGADVMKRIAAPMIGGLFTSFLMELLVYPAIYLLWKWHAEVKKVAGTPDRRRSRKPPWEADMFHNMLCAAPPLALSEALAGGPDCHFRRRRCSSPGGAPAPHRPPLDGHRRSDARLDGPARGSRSRHAGARHAKTRVRRYGRSLMKATRWLGVGLGIVTVALASCNRKPGGAPAPSGQGGDPAAAPAAPSMPGMEMGGTRRRRTKTGEGKEMASLPAGSIRLSPDRQQFLGVVLTTVGNRPMTRDVRTVGQVEYDERRLAFVNTKFCRMDRAARRRLHRGLRPEGPDVDGDLQSRARLCAGGVPCWR